MLKIFLTAVGAALAIFLGIFAFTSSPTSPAPESGSVGRLPSYETEVPLSTSSSLDVPAENSILPNLEDVPTPSSHIAATPPVPIFIGLPVPPIPTVSSAPLSQKPAAPTSPPSHVSPDELFIDSAGISSDTEYILHLSLHAADISFDTKTLLSGGVFKLPGDIIGEAIAKGSLTSEAAHTLQSFNAFSKAKVEYVKKIPIYGEVILVAERFIVAERLLQELIATALMTGEGSLSFAELKAAYDGYEKKTGSLRQELQGSLANARPTQNVFTSIARFFGFRWAHAQIPSLNISLLKPFGGLISVVDLCACAGGLNLILTPAFTPGLANGDIATEPPDDHPISSDLITDEFEDELKGAVTKALGNIGTIKPLFISFATISSPLLFWNKMPLPAHWTVGMYTLSEVLLPCYGATLCLPLSVSMGIVGFMGTS